MKCIILVSLLAASLSLSAQDTGDKTNKMDKKNFSAWISKGIGVSFQKFEGLNSRIAAFPQYESLKDHMFTLSLGSMHVVNNFVTQITGTAGSSMSGDRDKKSSALRFLSGGLDFGYDVIPADRIMLYPLVGVGVETYHALFYKDISDVDFDDVLGSSEVQNDIRSVKFVNTFVTYRLGLGFALKSPRGHGTIGLQAGYAGSFSDKSWKSSENQSLNNSPSDNLSRIYVSLIFSGRMGMMRK